MRYETRKVTKGLDNKIKQLFKRVENIPDKDHRNAALNLSKYLFDLCITRDIPEDAMNTFTELARISVEGHVSQNQKKPEYVTYHDALIDVWKDHVDIFHSKVTTYRETSPHNLNVLAWNITNYKERDVAFKINEVLQTLQQHTNHRTLSDNEIRSSYRRVWGLQASLSNSSTEANAYLKASETYMNELKPRIKLPKVKLRQKKRKQSFLDRILNPVGILGNSSLNLYNKVKEGQGAEWIERVKKYSTRTYNLLKKAVTKLGEEVDLETAANRYSHQSSSDNRTPPVEKKHAYAECINELVSKLKDGDWKKGAKALAETAGYLPQLGRSALNKALCFNYKKAAVNTALTAAVLMFLANITLKNAEAPYHHNNLPKILLTATNLANNTLYVDLKEGYMPTNKEIALVLPEGIVIDKKYKSDVDILNVTGVETTLRNLIGTDHIKGSQAEKYGDMKVMPLGVEEYFTTNSKLDLALCPLDVTSYKICMTAGFNDTRSRHHKYEHNKHKGYDFDILNKYDHPGLDSLMSISNKAALTCYAGQLKGWGKNTALILGPSPKNSHTLFVRFSHNDKNFIETGDIVYPSQYVGIMGNTGNSRGKHVDVKIYHLKSDEESNILNNMMEDNFLLHCVQFLFSSSSKDGQALLDTLDITDRKRVTKAFGVFKKVSDKHADNTISNYVKYVDVEKWKGDCQLGWSVKQLLANTEYKIRIAASKSPYGNGLNRLLAQQESSSTKYQGQRTGSGQ